MMSLKNKRRTFLKTLSATALWPLCQPLLARPGKTQGLKRIAFIYHPDGVVLERFRGQGLSDLGPSLAPFAPYLDQMVFFDELSLGDGLGDGHIEPARMILTGDRLAHSKGSLDVHLAEHFRAPLIHLGISSAKSGGQSISYHPGGAELKADDNPLTAYQRYFSQKEIDPLDPAVVEQIQRDLARLLEITPEAEQLKLTLHQSALNEMLREQSSCQGYDQSLYPFDPKDLYHDQAVPTILSMQNHTLFKAFQCSLSPVATMQFSRHTSPMKMDFDFLREGDASHPWPMESHQASHNNEFIHSEQIRWFHLKMRELLDRLAKTKEGEGSMLDYSLLVFVTEISSGKNHSRSHMPYFTIGGQKAGINTGITIKAEQSSHSRLLATLAQAMGMPPQGGYQNAEPFSEFFSG